MQPPPLFAFGISHLPMLGWLAAAAAPILIHLLSRQRYREMSWAAMEYLLRALKRRSRRTQFEQWLLLALRMLLIVLVVVAVAEPYLERIGLGAAAAGRVHRVLAIDGSYSMAYRPGDQSRFDQAKQIARQIVEQSSQGDAFTLVLLASPPRVVVGTPSIVAAEVLAEIDALKRPDTTLDLPGSVAAIGQLIDRARRHDPGLAGHEVYVLSDLQRAGWAPQLSAPALKELRQRMRKLAETAAVALIDAGQPEAENLAVTELDMVEPVAALSQNVRFTATLANLGGRPRGRQPVELLVDGRRVKQEEVELAPWGKASVELSHRFATPGDHAVEVRTVGDQLDVDNHRWLAVPVRASLRVLCIDGRPSAVPFGGATDYVVRALAPETDPANPNLVRPDVATEAALTERDLDPYDCLFLADVAQFTAGEAERLRAYVDRGGSLVFFLGGRVMAEQYNRQLGQGRGEAGLLPARLGDVVSEPQYRLDPMEYAHPIVQAFRGRERAGLLTTPVMKHFRLELPKESPAKVVLRTGAGEPLVVEQSVGRGRVVLVATAAGDLSWTAMPVWPSFVPLVQEIVAFCAGGQLKQRNLRVGQPLSASAATQGTGEAATVRTPGGENRDVPLVSEAGRATFSFDDTYTAGIYRVRLPLPDDGTKSFAVNVDTAEGDLTQLDDGQLAELWPDASLVREGGWERVDRETAATIVHRGRLHVYLLYAALALIFVETFLAWRFGHHRT
jgi:uncharacterized membrane protein